AFGFRFVVLFIGTLEASGSKMASRGPSIDGGFVEVLNWLMCHPSVKRIGVTRHPAGSTARVSLYWLTSIGCQNGCQTTGIRNGVAAKNSINYVSREWRNWHTRQI